MNRVGVVQQGAEGGPELRHYEAAFSVLEACDGATDLTEFRQSVVMSLAKYYHVASTTFFVGSTTPLACLDPDPVINGITRGMLPEYQEAWHQHDLFAAPDTQPMFHASRVASLSELSTLSDSPKHYVADYLYRHGINCATALVLDLSGGRRGLIGLFDRDSQRLGPRELASLRLLAKPLSRIAQTLPGPGQPHSALARLSRRQVEVARLVSEGLSNRAIADLLSINEDSVKKYVSRILAESGCHNRTELALLVRGDA